MKGCLERNGVSCTTAGGIIWLIYNRNTIALGKLLDNNLFQLFVSPPVDVVAANENTGATILSSVTDVEEPVFGTAYSGI